MAEIVEEIGIEVEEVTEELIESMDVVSEASEVTDDVIDISETVDTALQTINEQGFSEMMTEDVALESDIDSEVANSVDSVVSGLEKEGIEEIGASAGSELSQASARAQAGADVAKGTKGLWEQLKQIGGITKKILEAYILIDFVGKMIDEIVIAIQDATKNPPWKGSLTEKQKAQLTKLQDAMGSLKPLMDGWKSALKPLEDNVYMSYGTMKTTVGGREEVIQVIDVVAYIIQDALQQMSQAHSITKGGIDGLSVIDLTQLSNYVFGAFADAQAVIDLRDNKGSIVTDDKLKMFKFPAEADDKEVNRVLNADFPEWKDNVKSQGFSLATMGASMATGAFTKSQVIMKVNSYLRENIYPQIKTAAKEAGQKAAKDYVNGEKANIILKALIPIVGPQQARDYGKQVQKAAIEKAQAAAKVAGKTKAEELKSHIESDLKPVVKEVLNANKDQMKLIGKYAAQQILNTVVPPGSGSKL